MIVLDEQLLGRDLDRLIMQWYRGTVRFITDLRPHTIIKDDGIPELLCQQPQPTFVTINERDFWRKTLANRQYCIVCFSLSDSQVHEISDSLRSLLRRPELRTKAQRMGKVIRITSREIRYYSVGHRRENMIPLV